MSEDRSDEDSILDVWYANFEQQCLQAIENESDLESQLQVHRDFYAQQIWASFHTGATAIAQLYKDRSQGSSAGSTSYWSPFQTAAGTVTSLFKEASNGIRHCSELGVEAGKQKRNKDIMNWAKKKRRNIRKEELLAYLAGKSLPARTHPQRSSPKPRMMVCGSPPSQSQAASMVVSSTPPPGSDPDPELHTFREALAICGSPMSRRAGRQSELSAFISSEFARHKRPASHDVDMGSPTHKRARFM